MTNKLKVLLIAPVDPYRSGIAKHSTQIAKELFRRENTEVKVISFSRLYPSFLFPGESDKDKISQSENVDTQFCLDSVNPFTWFKVIKKITTFEADLVIIPVWTFFTAPCLGYIAKRCILNGIKPVAVVHNAFDHEKSVWKNWLMKYLLKQFKSFVCHNKELADEISGVYPDAFIKVSPIPIFDNYPRAKGSLKRRAKHEFLYFGIIRDYKGVDLLIEAMSLLPKDLDYRLSIVGECWGKIEKYKDLCNKYELTNHIDFVDKYVTDEDAAEYFERADAVILPYKSMTGSGVIPLAYHYLKPVIATNLPAFHEVIKQKQTGLIADDVSAAGIGKILMQFAYEYDSTALRENIEDYRATFSWNRFADTILESGKCED